MRSICLFLFAASLCSAQWLRPDDPKCQANTVLTSMPGCKVLRCRVAQHNLFEMPVSKTDPRKKAVEGEYQNFAYACPKDLSPLQIARNAENAFRTAGYNIVFTDRYATTRFYVTARKGPQWAYVAASGSDYELVAVKTKEMEQVMEAGADGWIQQINQTGRVSIYGINFDTGKATIRADSEKVLGELAALLQKQPEWSLVVAGHTDSTGTDAVNTPLSRQRAEAVIAWLAGKGIDKMRLVPAGFGSKRPLADNATDEGKARNRRVDLVKLY